MAIIINQLSKKKQKLHWSWNFVNFSIHCDSFNLYDIYLIWKCKKKRKNNLISNEDR